MILQELKNTVKKMEKFSLSDLINKLSFTQEDIDKALEFLMVSGKIELIKAEQNSICSSKGCSSCSCSASYYDEKYYRWLS